MGTPPILLNCRSGRFCLFTVIYTIPSLRCPSRLNIGGILVVATALSGLVFPTVSHAWEEEGHQIVAHIAYGRLSPKARAVANKLLQTPLPPVGITRESKDFVAASVWADQVRGDSNYKQTGPWHYIDYPFGITPETSLPTDLPEKENIVIALKREIAVLRNPAAKQTDRATALRFLIHFVGDIHQPLHCATRVSPLSPQGDRGGNEYRIHPEGEDQNESLHAYWDSGLGEFSQSSGQVKVMAARAMQANPASVAGWKVGGVTAFNQWAGESKWLANNFVYNGLRRGKQPPATYVQAGHKVVNKRVAWAGYRLALLLNYLLAGG